MSVASGRPWGGGLTGTWTPERVDTLTALVEAGKTFREIGALMGLTKNKVLAKASRLGLVSASSRLPAMRARTPAPTVPCPFPDPGHCLWSFGEPRAPGFRFCGGPVHGAGESWCAEHRARVYVKPAVRGEGG